MLPDRSQARPTRHWIVVPIALAVLALIAQAPAHAAQTTFAQFTQTNPGTPFVFTNNTTSGTVGIQSFSTTVNFNFTAGSGLSTATQVATLTLTASAGPSATATSGSVGGTTFDSQPIDGNGPVVDKLTITAGGHNLLTETFTGSIMGIQGGTQSILSGNSDPMGGNNTVTFSSDFLTFAPNGGNPNSYQLGLTGMTSPLSIGPGSYLNSFAASITGAFSSSTFSPSVPEPASLAMFGTGIFATLVLATQRKRLAMLGRAA
jgi:hypothetical protein